MRTISNGHFTLENKIGEGSFANVYLGKEVSTMATVSIKVINKEHFNESQLDRVHREVNLIKDLDHPFIVSFYDISEDDKKIYIVMEHVEHGNILDFVNNRGELSEDEARHYFCQLISALEYLHEEKHIVHRDLKAENIMLDRYNNIRLIDFGLSNIFSLDNPFFTTACGSPAYACPEMIKGEQYSVASDIWSAGILLYAMCDCELPFQDENAQRLLQKIIYTEPRYPATWSPQLRDLLMRMLCKHPQNRITLEKIKEHPWFSQSNLSFMMDRRFGIDKFWRIYEVPPGEESIDQEIIKHMVSLGFDSKVLIQAFLGNDICGDSDCVYSLAVYKILKREKIKDEMDSISFQNIGHIKHHCSMTLSCHHFDDLPYAIPHSNPLSPPAHIHSLPTTFGRTLPPQRKDSSKNAIKIPVPNNDRTKPRLEIDTGKNDVPTKISRVVDRTGGSIMSNPNYTTPLSPIIAKPNPISQKRTVFSGTHRRSSSITKKTKLDPIFL